MDKFSEKDELYESRKLFYAKIRVLMEKRTGGESRMGYLHTLT